MAELSVVNGDVVTPPGTPVESLDDTGTVWRRVWSLPDRLVVEFVGVATAESRDPHEPVRFDRALPADLRRHLELDHVLPLSLARRGELVLHAGVVSRGGAGLVLIGQSGAGKSTLVAFCGQSGWAVGGDDGVVLDPGQPWTARPTHGGLRLTHESLELLGWDRSGYRESAGKWDASSGEVALGLPEPVPVAAVLVLEPAGPASDAAVTPLRGVEAHAALFRGVFHADPRDAAAMARVVRLLAELAGSVHVGRLVVPRGRQGLAAAEGVLADLVAAGS